MGLVPVLISQEIIKDFDETFITQSATKILLRHVDERNPQERLVQQVADLFGFSPEMKEVFRSLRKVTGEYSEALIMSEGLGSGVVQLRLLEEEFWLMTSDNTSSEVLKHIVRYLIEEKGLSRTEALMTACFKLANRYPKGIPDSNVQAVVNEIVNSL